MRHWSTELLIDLAWLQVGYGDIPVKKYHSWGTGFFINVALVKWGSHGTAGTKIEAMLDCLRLEASPAVAKNLIILSECINDYMKNHTITSNKPTSNGKNKTIVNINLTNVNLFAITNDICLVSRIDTISLDKNATKSGFVVSGLKFSNIPINSGIYTCQRTEEMTSAFCFVKLARIDNEMGVLSLQFLELVDIFWSPNLHLKCLTIINELKQFKNDIQESLKIFNNNVKKNSDSKNHWCVTFKGDTGIHMQLSQHHKLLFNFG